MHTAQDATNSSDNERCRAGATLKTIFGDTEMPSVSTQANARVSLLGLSDESSTAHGVYAARQAAGNPGLRLSCILSHDETAQGDVPIGEWRKQILPVDALALDFPRKRHGMTA